MLCVSCCVNLLVIVLYLCVGVCSECPSLRCVCHHVRIRRVTGPNKHNNRNKKTHTHVPLLTRHREATKKLDLFKMPKVLVIHLKRFSYANRIWRDKIDAMIDYPLSGLDLTKYALGPQNEPAIYDLFAVSVS